MADEVFERVSPVAVESPCVLVCVLDRTTGWCLGCGRTGDEIAGWTLADTARRKSVLDQLPARMALLNRQNLSGTPPP